MAFFGVVGLDYAQAASTRNRHVDGASESLAYGRPVPMLQTRFRISPSWPLWPHGGCGSELKGLDVTVHTMLLTSC